MDDADRRAQIFRAVFPETTWVVIAVIQMPLSAMASLAGMDEVLTTRMLSSEISVQWALRRAPAAADQLVAAITTQLVGAGYIEITAPRAPTPGCVRRRRPARDVGPIPSEPDTLCG